MKHKGCGAQRGKKSLCGSSDGSLITAAAELRSGTASRGVCRKRVEFLIHRIRKLQSVRYNMLMVRFTATAVASVIATIDIVTTATAAAATPPPPPPPTTTTTTDAI